MNGITVAGYVLTPIEISAEYQLLLSPLCLPHETTIHGHKYVFAHRFLPGDEWVCGGLTKRTRLGPFASLEAAVRAAEADANEK